jgi:Delta7-sterol 5-desaturase
MDSMLDSLRSLSSLQALFLFLIENALIAIGVVWAARLINNNKELGTVQSKKIAVITIILNTVITFIGYLLWKSGFIHFSIAFNYRVITDGLILVLLMDMFMFFFHYSIHKIEFVNKKIHGLHHRQINPTAIDLFVLHPLEVIGFGGIWLLLISFYPFNIYAVCWYLIFNVLFGMMGHLSKEVFPAWFVRNRYVNWIATPTFHFIHHQYEAYHFGFYILFWDRAMNTIYPEYEELFVKLRKAK